MAHDNYQIMISLALDGELEEADRKVLDHHLVDCSTCTIMWEDMNALDMILGDPFEFAPSVDFTAKVMGKIETYETRKQWTPWVIAALIVVSVVTALSVAIPVLVVTSGIGAEIAGSAAFVSAGQWFTGILSYGTDGISLLTNWLNYIFTDPAAMAVVLTALILASTWIGIRESMRFTALTTQQSAQPI